MLRQSEKKLRDAMLSEMDMSLSYTAYDIAMNIMGIPERVVFLDKDKTRDLSALQKACGNAPFISYEIDDDVILTA